jgi:hypothetical protein
MKQTWGQHAKDAIGEAYLEWANAYGAPIGPWSTGCEKLRFLKMMDKYYPFGERKMWPYKAWLKERKKIVNWLFTVEVPMNVGLFE